jgi:hypothetical protein
VARDIAINAFEEKVIIVEEQRQILSTWFGWKIECDIAGGETSRL